MPQRSIDVLVLGMTPETVKTRFGRPQRIVRSSESETGRPISAWIYSHRRLVATFRRVRGNRFTLAGLSTTSPSQHTARGARVGTSTAALRARVSDPDCDTVEREVWCTLGDGRPGSRQTVFVLRHGRVREIRILVTFP